MRNGSLDSDVRSRMRLRTAPVQTWAGRAAALWCIAFAALHLFWAFGGSAGLASSAGRDLANRRPTNFVVLGLYGVALVLLCGVALIRVASSAHASHGAQQPSSSWPLSAWACFCVAWCWK